MFSVLGAALAIACCLYSCKPVEAPFQETTGVTLTPASVSIFPGDAVTLEAAVAPSNATSTLLTWTSSDSKVASVDNWGRVTGVAPGSCVITAKTASGGYTATCNVTVKPIAETSISINPSELTVYYDETETVTVVFVPDNASYKTVTWKSADNTIATVDENGKVKGVGLGSTTITATSKNGKTATCNVTVAVRMPTEAETLDLWKTDNAGFRGLYGAKSDEGKTAGDGGWLKFANGAASWTDNNTGRVRTATLTLSTGSSITVTQLAGVDFTGSWTVQSRLFNPNLGREDKPKGTTGADKSSVTITSVTGDAETLDGHVNAFELKGLYNNATMKVAIEIDYDKKDVKIGLFFDKRTTQLAKDGVYCAFIPELEGARWSAYNFAPKSFGKDNCNYEWMWLAFEDFKTFRCVPHVQNVICGDSTLQLIGISVVIGTTSDPAALGTSYNTIYQANFNGSDTEGFALLR